MMPHRSARQKQFDDWHPTIARWLGMGLILFYAIGRTLNLPVPDALLIAAAGLIGYKSVKGNGGEAKSNAPRQE